MFAQERHNEIIKLVREKRRMNFVDLQRLLKVSPATLRRDLTELEESGDIIRVHGGVLDPSYVRSEISFDERLLKNNSAKKAIAKKVASLIPPGASVFIDAGSTCLEAGKALLGRKDLRIITHSVLLLEASLRGEADILCLGGQLRKISGALIGSAALGALAQLKVDFALLAASGLDAIEGCSTTELSEAEMKKAIISRAARKILLADHTKWQKPSTVLFAPWPSLNDWITDRPLSPKESKSLRASGLTIHSCE
ncbi:DeoR/GlpR family DNA-binding transcription regulator [soil metagenome]